MIERFFRPLPTVLEGAKNTCAPDTQGRVAKPVTTAGEAQKVYGSKMQEVLEKSFGLKAFRPGQKEVILHSLAQKDCFVLMPTGGGKSLCFQVPALVLPGVTIVVSPLISLMQNQVAILRQKKIEANFLNSTQTNKEAIMNDLLKKVPQTKLLYITPETITLSSNTIKSLKSLYLRDLLSLIVVDEAHCISTWGHDFRSSYRKLSTLRSLFPKTPIMALTATATKKVQDDICQQLCLKAPYVYQKSFNRPNIKYIIANKEDIPNTFDHIVNLIKREFEDKTGIIYCTKRSDCELLAGMLSESGVPAEAYHGSLNAKKRQLVQEEWEKGIKKTVVATTAFGMGIDKGDVRYVIHYNIPKSMEEFYQESGRAGRDGEQSYSFIYFSLEDVRRLKFTIEINMEAEEQNKGVINKTGGCSQKDLDNLESVLEFCSERTCRRKAILKFFGETWDSSKTVPREKCCDVCDPNIEKRKREGPEEQSKLIPFKKQKKSNSECGNSIRGEDTDEDEIEDDDDNMTAFKVPTKFSGFGRPPPLSLPSLSAGALGECTFRTASGKAIPTGSLSRGSSSFGRLPSISGPSLQSTQPMNSGVDTAKTLSQKRSSSGSISPSVSGKLTEKSKQAGRERKRMLMAEGLDEDIIDRMNVSKIQDMDPSTRQTWFTKILDSVKDRNEASRIEYSIFSKSTTKDEYNNFARSWNK